MKFWCGNPYVVEFVTIQSIIDKLKARAAKTPPGYWVIGYYYDDTKVERRPPAHQQGSGQGLDRSSGRW